MSTPINQPLALPGAAEANSSITTTTDACHQDDPLAVVKAQVADPCVDISANRNAAIKRAADNGQHDVVQFLLADEDLNPGRDRGFELALSCRAGDMETVQRLLADPCVSPEDCVDALRSASRLGRTQVVRCLLVDGRIDPVRQFDDSVQLAAAHGHCDVLELFLEDARVDIPALVCFAGAGDLKRVKAILGDVSSDAAAVSTEVMHCALLLACKFGRAGVVELLLNESRLRDDTSFEYTQGLAFASENGHLDVVKLLLADPRVKPLDLPGDFVFTASKNGHSGVVELLMLDERISAGRSPTQALRYYSHAGMTRQLGELLVTLPDTVPSHELNSALIATCKCGQVLSLTLLLADARVDPAAVADGGFKLACRYGHSDVVEYLLADTRIDLSACMSESLAWACRCGHEAVVKLLLADPRVDPGALEGEALAEACNNGRDELVKLLLADERVDPSVGGGLVGDNRAILHASASGCASIVRLLMADSRVDASADGNSALRWASENGFASVVKVLLTDSRVAESDGESLSLLKACAKGRLSVVRFLVNRMGTLPSPEHLMAAADHHESVIQLLLDRHPGVLLSMFNSSVKYARAGPLGVQLAKWEARSAKALLLCVLRTQKVTVAARVSDVLRAALEEWARFDIIE